MELRINVEEKYLNTFLDFMKTLNYVKVEEVVSKVAYKESAAEGFQRAAKDAEMLTMAEEGIEDYAKLIGE